MAEENQYGIENVKKILAILVEGGEVAENIVKLAQDKDLKWYQKITPVMKLGDEILALFTVDYKLLVPEFKDITPEEEEEIKAWARKEFDIDDDALEGKIEKGMDVILSVKDVILEVIDFAKSFKKQPDVVA